MRRFIVGLCALAVLSTGGARAAAPASPGLVQADAAYLLTVQTPDGALAMSYDKTWIQPYFANIGARGLARAYAVSGNTLYRDAAAAWCAWYQAHMNARGYVTDYRLIDGEWRSGDYVAGRFVPGFFDSTDSYAATYLQAVGELRLAAGIDAIRPYAHGVDLALDAIESTADAHDGLTWATPTYHEKYAMDNAEVFEGLLAAASLEQALGNGSAATNAATHARRVQQSISFFFNGDRGAYDWAIGESGVHASADWRQFYPTATAQAWVVKARLLDGASASWLMHRFDTEQPGWDSPQTTSIVVDHNEEIGYYPAVALAFLDVGLRSRARNAWNNFEASATSTGRTYPFHPGAAGALIMLAADDHFLDGDG